MSSQASHAITPFLRFKDNTEEANRSRSSSLAIVDCSR